MVALLRLQVVSDRGVGVDRRNLDWSVLPPRRVRSACIAETLSPTSRSAIEPFILRTIEDY